LLLQKQKETCSCHPEEGRNPLMNSNDVFLCRFKTFTNEHITDINSIPAEPDGMLLEDRTWLRTMLKSRLEINRRIDTVFYGQPVFGKPSFRASPGSLLAVLISGMI
jgi:hypothetical protein